MLLIYLILSFALVFQSGVFWSAYKIDKVDGKDSPKMLWWSIGLGILGLYFMICLVGRAGSL